MKNFYFPIKLLKNGFVANVKSLVLACCITNSLRKKDKLRLRKFCMFYATNKKTVTKI